MAFYKELDKRMAQQKQGVVDNYLVKAFLFARGYDTYIVLISSVNKRLLDDTILYWLVYCNCKY